MSTTPNTVHTIRIDDQALLLIKDALIAYRTANPTPINDLYGNNLLQTIPDAIDSTIGSPSGLTHGFVV